MFEHFPDGVKIGPDLEEDQTDNRCPIYDADDWWDQIAIGTLQAGEIKDFIMTGVMTLRGGASIFGCKPMNPFESKYDHLEVLQYGATNDPNEIKLRVRNRHTAAVDFGTDQWTFSYWNTSQPA